MLRELELEQAARRAWVNELAARWQLVRAAESLTPEELERQADRCDRALSHMFYRAYPRPGFTVTVPRDYFAAAVGGALEPGGLLRIIADAMIGAGCTNLQLDGDELERFDPATDPPFTVEESFISGNPGTEVDHATAADPVFTWLDDD